MLNTAMIAQLILDIMPNKGNSDPGHESTLPGESTDTEHSEG